MEDRFAYGDVHECVRAAKSAVREVKQLLTKPSPANADQAATILREVEVQLGCATAILSAKGKSPDPAIRADLEDLQDQVAVLARFLSEADKLLSSWLRAVRAKRGGYTQQGQAAPLILVNKLRAEG